ncbi:LCP family protein [Blautia sp. CLA-JM-H16]|uniref:LCP family protein n=1 Tax=Blautia aquisgranensis TaxID=3133153 RepID=A0ABV1BFD8_9FIRM
MSKPRKKRKKLLFVLEIIVLLLFIGGLFVYGQISAKLDKIDIQETDLSDQDIVTNDQAPQMTGYTTYALFGLDHRNKNEKLNTENSDTIIIASINNDTKSIKLVSIYRDTLLNVKDDTYSKANAAYALGGPAQAVSMLNTNLDLNITDYVAIDFDALVTVVDCLGGLDIPLSYAEMVHMNNYCVETSEETGKSYTPIELPDPKPDDIEATLGTYHLNGVQATSYCRIRYTASLDMGRTERQRRVIQMIVDKAKKAGLSTIFDIMDQVFPMIKTTVSKTEILKLLPTMIGYNIENTTGFPEDYNFATVKGSVIVPTTLESNVLKLHQFLYGATNYTPTQEVMNKSEQIISIAGGGDVQTDTQDGTETSENNSYVYNADDSEDMDYSAENNVDNTDYSTENNVDDTDYSVENNTDDTDYSGDDYNSGSDDSEYDSDYTADYDDNFSDDE